jgi:hypothetical protein
MRHFKLIFTIFLSYCYVFPLIAQDVTAPSSSPYGGQTVQPSEKKPMPKDPRYLPAPMVPPSLRKSLKPGMMSVFTQSGEVDPEALLKDQRERDASKNRYYESNNEALMTKDEHLYFEKKISRQFGVDRYPEPRGIERVYTETPARRFQIVFFTALPFMLALSYGAVRSTKSSGSFSGPQTAGFLTAGTTAALGIAWYDQSEWRKSLPVESGGLNPNTESTATARDRSVSQTTAGPDIPLLQVAISAKF